MHQHSEGRNADAPELSLIDDTWHDNWVQTFLCTEWYRNGHAEQLKLSTSLSEEEHALMNVTGWSSVDGRAEAYAAYTASEICALTANPEGVHQPMSG